MAQNQQDIANAWIGFDEARRSELLRKMTPEQKRNLRAALEAMGHGVPSPNPAGSAPAPRQPEARTAGNYAREIAQGAARGISDDIIGLYTTVRHPIDSSTELGEQAANAVRAARDTYRSEKGAAPLTAAALAAMENAPVIGGMVRHAEEGSGYFSPESVGAAAEGMVSFGAPELAGKAIGLAPRAGDAARTVTGTGTRTVRDLVEDTRKANAEAAEGYKTATEKHRAEAEEAAHQTKGNELEHVRKVQAEASKLRAKQIQAEREAAAQHAAKLEEVRKANAEAVRAQKKIPVTEEKLKTAGRELQAQIETARNKALKIGNEKYNAVNKALNPIPADQEAIESAYHAAAESLGEVQNEPPILNKLGKALKNNQELTYKDLQTLYSELNEQLSKGTLPAPTYHAYDVLHEAVADDMQRIANTQGEPIDAANVPRQPKVIEDPETGEEETVQEPVYRTTMGKQLYDARNYWRRMKQAFGKEYNPTDAGNRVRERALGKTAAEDEEANRVRLLGSFDASIPQTVEHISNLRKGLESLGEPKPIREAVTPLPEKPQMASRAAAEAQAERSVAPPERVLPSDRPVEPAPRKIGAAEIKKAKTEGLRKRAEAIRRYTDRAAMYVTAYRALTAGARALAGDVGAAAAIPGDLGEGALVAAGGHMFSRLLQNPRVVDFLTNATEKDIESIPEDMRGDFPEVVKQAQSRGIRVSTAVLRAATQAAIRSAQLGPRKPEMHPTDAWAGGHH